MNDRHAPHAVHAEYGSFDQASEAEVRDVMRSGVVAVPEDASLRQVRRAMRSHSVHAVLVVSSSHGQPLGWITARGLLAWLALYPGAHPRGELAARFWPDVLDESARQSLRNALWILRRDLGDAASALRVDGDELALDGEVAVDLSLIHI